MKFSEATNELFSALVSFQEDCPTIEKDAEVKVYKDDEFKYKFAYATLGNIIKTTKPILTKHGLSFSQEVYADGVETILLHRSGQWMSTRALPIKLDGSEQDTGSSITYKKRYQLGAVLGLDIDEDDDANTADGNDREYTRSPETKSKSKPKPKSNKGKTKSNEKKTESNESDLGGDFDPIVDVGFENEEAIEDYLANETNRNRLIKWYQAGISGDDKESFLENWQQPAMDRLDEIKS